MKPPNRQDRVLLPIKLTVFPNPASNYLNITWTTEGVGERQVQLFHPNGKVIAVIENLESTATAIILDLNNYQISNGVYYIRLRDGEKILQMEKIVIMK